MREYAACRNWLPQPDHRSPIGGRSGMSSVARRSAGTVKPEFVSRIRPSNASRSVSE
jgi:hypothetical protein